MTDSISESIRLFRQYRNDESDAADQLFERYVNRLTALVRQRMSPRLAQRLDAEDVVQSAYRSFFVRAKDGNFEVKRGGDLWRLLAAITMNKLGRQIERHQAAKRNMNAELQPTDSTPQLADRLSAMTPTADDEAQFREELDQLTEGFTEGQVQMLTMRLAGYKLTEIAEQMGRTERTVRRLLDRVKSRLEQRLESLE